MAQRFVSIWFPFLLTDWFTVRKPELAQLPLVLARPDHGRMVITALNLIAGTKGIETGMLVADARAIHPALEVINDPPGLAEKLLKKIAVWSVCFSPVVGMDIPDGIIMEVTGCSHLWGGDQYYLTEINKRISARGYQLRTAMADSIGAAWAVARFGKEPIVPAGSAMQSLLNLPPTALRLEPETIERLHKLGLSQISQFIKMPETALRRRFGKQLLLKLHQALGKEAEFIEAVETPLPFQERLPCMEPIVSASGIEIALQRLLETLCDRMKKEQKGLRQARLKCFRVDGEIIIVEIGTTSPSSNVKHLFKLFEIKLPGIQPDLGIELFLLEAPKVEDDTPMQEKLWDSSCGLHHPGLSELIDRIGGKIGTGAIHRFLPNEHHWPERSIKPAETLLEEPATSWTLARPRPVQLLQKPEKIEVTAPIPDYPPMMFRHKGVLHKIIRSDGPERIEQEWWLQEGQHRDYYAVEDEEGRRYWVFRSGHYDEERSYQWFIHGFFA